MDRWSIVAHTACRQVYGYTSAVGAIGQAMGITVRAPRHAHACVDVTEPAAANAGYTQQQQRRRAGSSSNARAAGELADRKEQRAGSRSRARAPHRSLFCTPAAPSRDYHLIIAICNLPGGSFSRKNGPRDNGGPARDSHEGPLA